MEGSKFRQIIIGAILDLLGVKVKYGGFKFQADYNWSNVGFAGR